MASDNKEWLIKADEANRARFRAEQDRQGEPSLSVDIENVKAGEPTRQVEISLSSLEQVVQRGEALKDSLFFTPAKAVRNPDDVLELEDCTAKFYARLTPEGQEQLAVIVESRTPPGDDGKPSRIVSDHDNLQIYAEAGQEYREALSRGQESRLVVQVVGPGPDRDKAVARVLGQVSDREHDRNGGSMSFEEADKYVKDRGSQDIFLLNSPGTHLPVGAEFEIAKTSEADSRTTQATKLNNSIEFSHFHPERESENYVIGRWALPGEPPRPGEKREVAWGGKQREEMGGKPLDYVVDLNGTSDGRNVPDDAPWVRIRKSETTLNRGVIEEVSPTRDDAVASHREAVNRDRTIQLAMTPNWHQELQMPSRPDSPKR